MLFSLLVGSATRFVLIVSSLFLGALGRSSGVETALVAIALDAGDGAWNGVGDACG